MGALRVFPGGRADRVSVLQESPFPTHQAHPLPSQHPLGNPSTPPPPNRGPPWESCSTFTMTGRWGSLVLSLKRLPHLAVIVEVLQDSQGGPAVGRAAGKGFPLDVEVGGSDRGSGRWRGAFPPPPRCGARGWG